MYMKCISAALLYKYHKYISSDSPRSPLGTPFLDQVTRWPSEREWIRDSWSDAFLRFLQCIRRQAEHAWAPDGPPRMSTPAIAE